MRGAGREERGVERGTERGTERLRGGKGERPVKVGSSERCDAHDRPDRASATHNYLPVAFRDPHARSSSLLTLCTHSLTPPEAVSNKKEKIIMAVHLALRQNFHSHLLIIFFAKISQKNMKVSTGLNTIYPNH